MKDVMIKDVTINVTNISDKELDVLKTLLFYMYSKDSRMDFTVTVK